MNKSFVVASLIWFLIGCAVFGMGITRHLHSEQKGHEDKTHSDDKKVHQTPEHGKDGEQKQPSENHH
jgi:hypothetical protein